MMVTRGIYWFWSRTNVRRYIWSHVSIGGSRLEYGGRGIELFLGFLVAGTILALALWGLQFLALTLAGPLSGSLLWGIALYPVMGILGLIAVYRRHRYMIRRTSWRGINCGLTGSTFGYIGRIALPVLLTILTLGLAYPLVTVTSQKYLVSRMSIGSLAFEYKGRTSDILGSWLICWLVFPFTGGLSLVWWRSRALAYQLRQTSLGSLRFSSTLRPMRGVGIYFFGGLLAGLIVYGLVFLISGSGILTAMLLDVSGGSIGGFYSVVLPVLLLLPFLAPVSYAAYLYFIDYPFTEYLLQTTEIVGTINLDAIVQAHDRAHGPGDGLDAILGMDGI